MGRLSNSFDLDSQPHGIWAINSEVECLLYTEYVGGSIPSSPMIYKLKTMLKVRCKDCNKEIEAVSNQIKCCGCPNMTTISDNTITALDLSRVVMLNSVSKPKNETVLSSEDLRFQEERKTRKINRSLLDSVDIR